MTLEQKIDICLEFIATTDMRRLPELKALAKEALKTGASEAKPETCRERLKREHPDKIFDRAYGGCYGCPHVFGYAPKPKWCGGGDHILCWKCWDRPVRNGGE